MNRVFVLEVVGERVCKHTACLIVVTLAGNVT